MRNAKVSLVISALLAGCAGQPEYQAPQREPARSVAKPAQVSSVSTLDSYKRDLAIRITQASSDKVFAGRPQALLRAVVVVKYVVDAHGNLVRTEIMRSNRDGITETAALAAIQTAAPFPKPASYLLRHGRVDIVETWLFNDDGRFQLRTMAEAQMDQ